MTTFLLGLALSISAPGPKEAAKDPPHIGTWSIAKLVIGGQEVPTPGGTVTFEGDGKFTSLEQDAMKPKNKGSVTVDTKKTPFEMDIVEPSNGKGKASQAIFKIDGDTMTICVAIDPDDAARPTKFESPGDSQIVLMILKRVKKD
jgi:uncharacterized protein (TIGR03067 family)